MIVVDEPTVVVEEGQGVTVVSGSPGFIVTELETDTIVVSQDTTLSVVAVESDVIVAPVQSSVTVVANERGYVGPQIFVQATAPVSPALNDIWIRTA
jgi:hypothetical protein